MTTTTTDTTAPHGAAPLTLHTEPVVELDVHAGPEPGAWNDLPGGGRVLLDAEGRPTKLTAPSVEMIDGVHAAAETLLGAWVTPGPWVHAVRSRMTAPLCRLADDQPTHTITFTPAGPFTFRRVPNLPGDVALGGNGAATIANFLAAAQPRTWLVRLREDLPGFGGAWTRAEWETVDAPAWGLDRGVWLYQGQPTPGGQPGAVVVTELGKWEAAPVDERRCEADAARGEDPRA